MYSRGDLVVVKPIKKPLISGGLYQLAKSSPAKSVAVKDDFYDIFSKKIDHIGMGDVVMILESFPVKGMMGIDVIRLKLMTAKGIVGYIFFQSDRVKFVKAKK
jgi:hypothetical protein